MEFRRIGTIAEIVIEYEEFKARVAAGEIAPLDEVRDSYFTDNEWRTVNNLRVFHKLAPGSHEKGPILLADLARRDAQEAAGRRAVEIFSAGQQLLRQLDEQLAMFTRERMSKLARESSEVRGISELIAIPAFGGRTVFHLVYREDRVDIHMLEYPRDPMKFEVRPGDTPESMRERVRYEPEAIQPEIARLDYEQLPPAMSTWDELRILAMRAAREPEDLAPNIADGVMYNHELLTGDENYAAFWHSPAARGQDEAAELILNYAKALRRAGLRYGDFLMPLSPPRT